MPYSANFGMTGIEKARDGLQKKHELCQKLLAPEMGYCFEVAASDVGKGVVVLYKPIEYPPHPVLLQMEIRLLEECIRSVPGTLSGYDL